MDIGNRSITLLLVWLVVLIMASAGARAAAQAFCRSQFSLANEACSLRTINTGTNPARPLHSNGSSYEMQSERHDREHLHGRRHELGQHGGGSDPYDTACCRRLMGIDNACICQTMSYLPVFMSRVKHAIKLIPVPGCDVSFECAAVY
jgi:hypothetical protein